MIMTIREFCRLILGDGNCDLIEETKLDEKLLIEKKYLERLSKYIWDVSDKKWKRTCIKDIIKKPNMDNGKVYELLVYEWLKENGFKIEEQVLIQEEDCLKKKNYDADGFFDDIIFDVKKFGIGYPLLKIFNRKLQEEIPDYYIIVSGDLDLPSRIIEKEYLSRILDWKKKILQSKSLGGSHMIYDSKNRIRIRAISKRMKTFSCVSEIDNSKWAQENEKYFFYHGSQFCTKKPYMIICPFLPEDFPFFETDREKMASSFRFLCRRMFMNLLKNDEELGRYDGGSKQHISLATASKNLSGVMFLDISEVWTYENCRCWIYINPNANNKIPEYVINNRFRTLGAYIDDFKYDNY